MDSIEGFETLEELERDYYQAKKDLAAAEEAVKILKSKIVELVPPEGYEGNIYEVRHISKRGNVDWKSAVAELVYGDEDKMLELGGKHRGKGSNYWMIKRREE